MINVEQVTSWKFKYHYRTM